MAGSRRESKALIQMIKSSGSQQVMPISEEEEYYYDDYEDDDSPEFSPMRYKKRSWFDPKRIYAALSYDNIKASMQWLLQTASIEISFNVSGPFQ